ncbi:hypothetical protein [uncultured Tateyamaria sp.]|uniref:hypothetical protein n=1 Tax=uncultured Tateyamaria sp. TaxID=455651 RepID=UPI00261B6317|nr:hypothetical protein [uncultured Tateyamaria sp.]
MFGADKIIGKLSAAVQGIELPKLGKDVEIPVYVVHNSLDAEDYFFIFDFEQFVESSRQGLFARPKLRVWAGRDDFSRTEFARQFRRSFAREFDIARAQLEAQGERKTGWFGFLKNTFGELKGASLGSFLSNLVLLAATTTGKAVLAQILPTSWMTSRSDAQKLDAAIDETQTKVDAALGALTITLHAELMEHAFKDGGSGRRSGLERDAWPLPAYVRQHLHDGKSGAWW